MTSWLSHSMEPPPPPTAVGFLLLAFLVGALLTWACWLHVNESVLHPRTLRFAYDVEAP